MLCEILNKKRLLASASNGYIRQNKKVICFQDVPLYSLAENIKFENEHINNGFFNEKDNFRYDPNKEGTQTLTVTYGGQSDTFEIKVSKRPQRQL